MTRDKTLEDLENENPPLTLTGTSSNAGAILGACTREARRFGCSKEAINNLRAEMLGGDYNNVLNTAMKYFDVE